MAHEHAVSMRSSAAVGGPPEYDSRRSATTIEIAGPETGSDPFIKRNRRGRCPLARHLFAKFSTNEGGGASRNSNDPDPLPLLDRRMK